MLQDGQSCPSASRVNGQDCRPTTQNFPQLYLGPPTGQQKISTNPESINPFNVMPTTSDGEMMSARYSRVRRGKALWQGDRASKWAVYMPALPTAWRVPDKQLVERAALLNLAQ